MNRKILQRRTAAAVATIAATLALVAGTAAWSSAGPQRVVITAKLPPSFTPVAAFKLTAVTAGPIEADSGKLTWINLPDIRGTRDGQAYTRGRSTATFTGTKGTLVIAEDTFIVAAGIGVDVATGTWKVLRGTGAYEGVTGRGRMAAVFGIPPPIKGGQYPIRYEGMLSSP